MDKTPYLHVVTEPRMMRGKGAPRSTLFGVLGMTKESGKMRSLGGLVENSKASASVGKGTLKKEPKRIHTEKGITGPASKTHVPGDHFAQVPYPGMYMSSLGKRL